MFGSVRLHFCKANKVEPNSNYSYFNSFELMFVNNSNQNQAKFQSQFFNEIEQEVQKSSNFYKTKLE